MKLSRFVTAAVTAVALAAALAACSATDGTYAAAPPAYGASGSCYYVDDVAEVTSLQAAGMCPVNWMPAPMPMAWRNQYAWYYDSPRYYDTYVPASRRTTYVTHVKVYEKAQPQAVRTAPKVTRPAQSKSSSLFGSGNGRAGGDSGSSRVAQSKPSSYKPAASTQQRSSSSFKSGPRR